MKNSRSTKGLVIGTIIVLVSAGIPLSIGGIISLTHSIPSYHEHPVMDGPRGTMLYVGGGGPGNFSKIQDAIDNATSGDTIFVFSGMYYENIEVDITVNVTGEDVDATVIDGGGSGNVVRITGDDCVFTGFTVRNGAVGVRLENCEGVQVDRCNCTDNNYGVDVNYYCYDNNVSNCGITNSGSRGISIGSSNTEGNEFYNNTITVADETGIYFSGHGSFKNAIDLSTTVNGCPVLFVTYEVNKTFDGVDAIVQPFETVKVSNYGLIIIYECYNVVVSNCTAKNHANAGIYISGDNTELVVRDCMVEDNNFGIHLADCEGAHVDSCALSGNHYAVEINYYCYDNNISNCVIENSGSRGISIGSSNTENNEFYNNTISVTVETGIHFYGVGSFKNKIDSTNTVNDCTVLFVTYEVNTTVDGVDAVVAAFEDIQVTNYGLIIIYECYDVVVSNCTAKNHANDGIYVGGDNTNLVIRDCMVEDNNIGIHMSDCEGAFVDNCSFSGNNYGVDINYYSYGNTISHCSVENSGSRGFSIGSSNTENNWLHNNTVTVTGEVGFYFYGVGSFNNMIDVSNTVNDCAFVFVTYEVNTTVDGVDCVVAPFETVKVSNYGLIIIYECYNVVVSNCTARNHANDGIYVGGDNTDVVIRDCMVEDNTIGIHMSDCENVFVDNCSFSGNNYGIDINYYSYDNMISDCCITDSGTRGISIGSSNTEDNEFYNNTINVSSETGIYFYSTSSFKNKIDTSNTVNGCPVLFVTYMVNQTVDGVDCVVAPYENIEVTNYGLIIVFSCTDVVVSNCTAKNHLNNGIYLGGDNIDVVVRQCMVEDNNVGVRFSDCEGATLDGCNLSNNNYGVDINYYCFDNMVVNCCINNSDNRGVSIGSSNTRDTIITGCRVVDNNRGIHVVGSGNVVYNNYFVNTDNAYDSGNNLWNITKTLGTNIVGGPYLGGNYWNDYLGVDTTGDGLGDTLLPYTSSGNILHGGDWHPLIQTENQVPIADFIFTPLTPTTDDIVVFTDTSVDLDGTVVGWLWDFGDMYLSIEQNPRHQYFNPGVYNVTLEVTDDEGGKGGVTKQITVTVFDGYIADLEFRWNLVSVPYREPLNKSDIVVVYNNSNLTWQQAVDGGVILPSVFGWNATSQNYEVTDVLYPGKGYWMYAYSACLLLRPVS